jgi:predicted NBD/HSP70 family sugar kinase
MGKSSSAPAAQRLAALEALFARVAAGDKETCKIVSTAGRHLGVLLNNLWVAFDPMQIVLGGTAMRFGETLLQPALKVLAEYARDAELPAPGIKASRYGIDAVAVGGAALVRHHITRPLQSQTGGGASDF